MQTTQYENNLQHLACREEMLGISLKRWTKTGTGQCLMHVHDDRQKSYRVKSGNEDGRKEPVFCSQKFLLHLLISEQPKHRLHDDLPHVQTLI
jgi:hypothetical protein